MSYATLALFYNKDLLPKAPTTFEEIMEFGKGFNNAKENKYALLWDIQNYYESRMFLTLYGAYEFGKGGTDAKDLGIDSSLAQQGMSAMKTLKAANNSNPVDMRNPQVRRGLFGEEKWPRLLTALGRFKAMTTVVSTMVSFQSQLLKVNSPEHSRQYV